MSLLVSAYLINCGIGTDAERECDDSDGCEANILMRLPQRVTNILD